MSTRHVQGSLISSPIVDLLCRFHFSVCLSNTLPGKYILGHPLPRGALGNALFRASFQCWFFGFLSLRNISRLPFGPPPSFSGHLKALVFLFTSPSSVLYSRTLFNYLPQTLLGSGPPPGSRVFPRLKGLLGRTEEESTLNMQPGGPRPTPQLNTLDRIASPSPGEGLYSNTVLFL